MNELLYVNPDWTFQETIDHLKTLRSNYEEILASFSYFELKQKVELQRNFRNSIYSLSFDEWKKDKIWDYINHFEFLYVLQGIANRQKRK